MLKHATIVLLIALTIRAQTFPDENGVLILDDVLFDQALEKYEFLLADFYAPWCGHWYQAIYTFSTELAPKFAQAAK